MNNCEGGRKTVRGFMMIVGFGLALLCLPAPRTPTLRISFWKRAALPRKSGSSSKPKRSKARRCNNKGSLPLPESSLPGRDSSGSDSRMCLFPHRVSRSRRPLSIRQSKCRHWQHVRQRPTERNGQFPFVRIPRHRPAVKTRFGSRDRSRGDEGDGIRGKRFSRSCPHCKRSGKQQLESAVAAILGQRGVRQRVLRLGRTKLVSPHDPPTRLGAAQRVHSAHNRCAVQRRL